MAMTKFGMFCYNELDKGVVQEVLIFCEDSEKLQLCDVVLIVYEIQHKMSKKCKQDEIILESMVQKTIILSYNVSFFQNKNGKF